MGSELKSAVVITALTALLLGVGYPLVITAVGRVAFPRQAAGSLVERDGRTVGSALIGQRFSGDRYFHGRPSAAGADGYDATASGGSNLGPTSKPLAERVARDTQALGGPAPVDLLSASASGLDPHISPEGAAVQVARVARARGIHPAEVQTLVDRHTDGRTLGLLGEPRVNVLLTNLDLDRAASP